MERPDRTDKGKLVDPGSLWPRIVREEKVKEVPVEIDHADLMRSVSVQLRLGIPEHMVYLLSVQDFIHQECNRLLMEIGGRELLNVNGETIKGYEFVQKLRNKLIDDLWRPFEEGFNDCGYTHAVVCHQFVVCLMTKMYSCRAKWARACN